MRQHSLRSVPTKRQLLWLDYIDVVERLFCWLADRIAHDADANIEVKLLFVIRVVRVAYPDLRTWW
jgi:hypothetical protein